MLLILYIRLPCISNDCPNFKASGVFVEQKLAGAKNTLAFCSRWSAKGIQKTKNEDVWKQCEPKIKKQVDGQKI